MKKAKKEKKTSSNASQSIEEIKKEKKDDIDSSGVSNQQLMLSFSLSRTLYMEQAAIDGV